MLAVVVVESLGLGNGRRLFVDDQVGHVPHVYHVFG